MNPRQAEFRSRIAEYSFSQLIFIISIQSHDVGIISCPFDRLFAKKPKQPV